jgi:2-aminoethylphosphonate-pyruvate transaminase
VILLNPGPVTLSPRVRAALAGETLCHREPEFAELTERVLRRLESVYADAASTHTAVLLTSSGTGAVEAMLATFARFETPTLVASNGVYGERMAAMLERQGKPCVHVRSAWTDALAPDTVAAALDAHPSVKHLALVHHETTTGRLNAIDAIAALCHERGVELIVDAVSSFGGEAISFDRWRPLAVAGTAGKCLHGAPGVSFVLCARHALGAAAGRASSVYLDLAAYHRDQVSGWSPFTQAVNVCAARDAALAELADSGGWHARRARYRVLTAETRRALGGLGVEALLQESESSAVLTSYRIPHGDTYERIHAGLKTHGFVIYAGQGDLSRSIFRISHMGAIGDDDVRALRRALDTVFFRA